MRLFQLPALISAVNGCKNLVYKCQKRMAHDIPVANKSSQFRLLYVLYAVLTLITVRIIFRLIEYANGYSSGIPVHEAYQYVFDSTAMFVALVLFNIVHPGRIMPGKECDFPSRKERKAMGKQHVWGRAQEFGMSREQGLELIGNVEARHGMFGRAERKETVSVGYLADV